MYRERRAESEDSLAIRGGGLHGYLRFVKNVIDPIFIREVYRHMLFRSSLFSPWRDSVFPFGIGKKPVTEEDSAKLSLLPREKQISSEFRFSFFFFR